MTSNVQLVF